jgi:signal peptidase II
LKKVGIIVLLVLFIDQLSKFYIKTHFHLNEGINVFGLDWFQLKFVENPGMAYGAEFGGLTGKIMLSVLRIFLISWIAYIIWKYSKIYTNLYFSIVAGLIFAGAIGNLFDSLFYGIIFDKGLVWNEQMQIWDGYSGLAQVNFQGYSGFLKGCVVDMFYFPLFDFYWPDWMPGIGGKHFEFFSYIFNVADSSITIGGVLFLIFRKKILAHS